MDFSHAKCWIVRKHGDLTKTNMGFGNQPAGFPRIKPDLSSITIEFFADFRWLFCWNLSIDLGIQPRTQVFDAQWDIVGI